MNRNKRRSTFFSKSKANKLTDILLHGYFKDSAWAVLADSCVHFLIEQNLGMSCRKFLRYNLRPLIKEVTRKTCNDRMFERGPKTKEADKRARNRRINVKYHAFVTILL